MNLKNTPIPPGTTIHTEKPFVYVLSSKCRTECCELCFKKGQLLKCSNCKYVYYCNKVCQKDGWPKHKLECKKLSRVSPRIVPDAARLLFHLIKKLEQGGDLIKGYYSDRNYRTFKDLMSHYNELKQDDNRLEHLTSLHGVLREFMDDDFVPNFSELMTIFGRMCVNSFNICNNEMQNLGVGIYLGASILDHSCEPNSVAIFEGTTLNIRNLVTLPKLEWSKIFISYIDVMATREERQKQLKETYYFLCQCLKCINPEPLEEMLGACCPNKDCDSYFNGTKMQAGDTCKKCGEKISQEYMSNFIEIYHFTDEQLQKMKDFIYLDVCKVCLEKQKGVLYKHNLKHVKTLDMAFESSIDLEQFDNATKYGLNLVDSFHKYYGELHPLTGLLHLKLAKLLFYHNRSGEAAINLKKAIQILNMTHGKASTLYKNEVLPLLQHIVS